MTTSPTSNLIELAIAREPRLQAIGNEMMRNFVASIMVAQTLEFEAAYNQVFGLLQTADTYKAEVKAKVDKDRGESEKMFADSVRDIVLAAFDSLPVKPDYGITVMLDPRYSYKNSDGSPMTDAQGNAIVKPFAEIRFQWEQKKAGGGAQRTISDTSRMGRPVGDYTIDGNVYKSMAAFIKSKPEWKESFEKGSLNSRDFLTEKGYTVPESPDKDDKGESHWIIQSPATDKAA